MNAAAKRMDRPGVDPMEVGRVRRDRSLMIVEPNHLLRWSLVAYLSRWFHVFPVGSIIEADKILGREPIDAVVVSDELGSHDAATLEQKALAFNPLTRVVYVVMSMGGDRKTAPTSVAIEKPFELARLARMLGVSTGSNLPRSYE